MMCCCGMRGQSGHVRLSIEKRVTRHAIPSPLPLFRAIDVVADPYSSTAQLIAMSYYSSRYMNGIPVTANTIPAQPSESKRDRKRRETVNKIETLHEESWKSRDE